MSKSNGKSNGKPSLKVCLLSPHPMVLEEFRRLLEDTGLHIAVKQIESMLAPDLRSLEVPKATAYVVDAHAARQATGRAAGATFSIVIPTPACWLWPTT